MNNGGRDRIWHPEVITPATEATLRNLERASLLSSFYLAGGTGLSLHFGHRTSLDLDFFATDLFDEERETLYQCGYNEGRWTNLHPGGRCTGWRALNGTCVPCPAR